MAWVALVLVAGILRLRHLGVRVFTHDECIHAYYSLALLSGGYQHDPVYHGPFLYHVNAVVYRLLGATDFTARLVPALAGVALVAGLWPFRRYLGRAGALLAAVFVTLSPTLVFYSRHLRNDIYAALFTLMWIYGTCRYLESRQTRWLYLVTLSMALSFVTKEVSFISGAIVGFYSLALALWPSGGRHSTGRRRSAGDLSILMITLVLPFTSGIGCTILGWDLRDPHTEAAIAVRGGLLVGLLFALSAIVACVWFAGPRRDRQGPPLREWARMMALFWMVQALLFTTFFTNTRGGLVSGIVGSLGHWLGQHEVGRGSQPWYYYSFLGGLYEFLPLLVFVAAVPWLLARLRRRKRDSTDGVEGAEGRSAETTSGSRARRDSLILIGWWTLAAWLGYTLAGEKMPWLLTHQVLPLCLVAGWVLGELLGAAGPMRALTRPALVALLAVGLLLTLRVTLRLNFVNDDLPTEPISYAQSGPGIERALKEIELIGRHTGEGLALRVAYDDESAWPFAWYLRHYPNAHMWRDPGDVESVAVILAGPKNRDALRWAVARSHRKRDYVLLWWPLQDYYADLTPGSIWRWLTDAELRERWLQIALHRHDPAADLEDWPLTKPFAMYVRRDLAVSGGTNP